MKIALVIKENRKQMVLTPESDYEKDMLADLRDSDQYITHMTTADFYDTLGEYTRFGSRGSDEYESTIIVIEKKKESDK